MRCRENALGYNGHSHRFKSEVQTNKAALTFMELNDLRTHVIFNDMFRKTRDGGPVIFSDRALRDGVAPHPTVIIDLLDAGTNCKGVSTRNITRSEFVLDWDRINDHDVHSSSRTVMASLMNLRWI